MLKVGDIVKIAKAHDDEPMQVVFINQVGTITDYNEARVYPFTVTFENEEVEKTNAKCGTYAWQGNQLEKVKFVDTKDLEYLIDALSTNCLRLEQIKLLVDNTLSSNNNLMLNARKQLNGLK